jgi:hypothetical protein
VTCNRCTLSANGTYGAERSITDIFRCKS